MVGDYMKALNRKEALVNAKANGTLDDFKPLTRDEAFTKKALELGGGDVAWEDIKNRPFGEKVEKKVLFDEPVTVSHIGMQYDGTYAHSVVISDAFGKNVLKLVEGEEYIVIFNGTKYSLTCETATNYLNRKIPFIGERWMYEWVDAKRGGQSTEDIIKPEDMCPFCINTYNSGMGNVMEVITFEADMSDHTHHCTVYQQNITITLLDPKYLPLLTSPNGTQYKLTVSDDGTLSATAV